MVEKVATREAERTLLLERAEELAAIDAAVADAVAGAGRFGVIEGPAGIGKSSLLAEGRAGAADAGIAVLSARGTEIERAFSFGVVRQLFETRLAQAEAAERARLLEGAAGHASRLFEPAQLAAEAPATEDAAFALLHGLYWLTLNLAESRPLFIAIDDLQWADAPSLRWLSYLARRMEGQAVCVLAAMRPVEEEDPRLAELLVDPAITLLHPKPLSAPSVADLVRAELAAEADEAFCLACHRTTGGNPLLLRGLLRALASEDVPPIASSAAIVERVAPDAIARSVRLRLSRLSPQAGRLARAVAVLGDGAELRHAAPLADLPVERAIQLADALMGAGVLRREPGLSFVHPVVRAAVYAILIAAGKAGWLAAASVAMGWPAFLLLAFLSYRYVPRRLDQLGAPPRPAAA